MTDTSCPLNTLHLATIVANFVHGHTGKSKGIDNSIYPDKWLICTHKHQSYGHTHELPSCAWLSRQHCQQQYRYSKPDLGQRRKLAHDLRQAGREGGREGARHPQYKCKWLQHHATPLPMHTACSMLSGNKNHQYIVICRGRLKCNAFFTQLQPHQLCSNQPRPQANSAKTALQASRLCPGPSPSWLVNEYIMLLVLSSLRDCKQASAAAILEASAV